MKRSIGAIGILLALIAALAVVGTAGAGHQVKSPVKGSFKYCSDPTFPPMEYKTTAGKAVGFDIDMANAIAKNWKVKAKFVETAFPGLLPALSAKRCNIVISGIFITPDRAQEFPRGVVHEDAPRARRAGGESEEDQGSERPRRARLSRFRPGTKYEEYLKALNDQFKSSGRPQFTLQSYPGDTDAVAQLLIGRADAVLTQDTSGAYQKQAHPGKLAIAYLFPETDAFGIYYRPSDKKLGTALRTAIKTLKKNGTLKKIAAKHQIPVSDVK